MRTPIVAGNWKMNKLLNEAVDLAEKISQNLNVSRIGHTEVILAPPHTHLYRVQEITANKSNLSLSAQNCHQEYEGAFTGEISAPMLRSLGMSWVILGHSERRQYFGENDKLIAQKVGVALESGLRPIYCCGELKEQRQNGTQQDVVSAQIKEGLFGLDKEQFSEVVIAYEPVWAIGTGLTASPQQAEDMHAFIRELVTTKYGKATAADLTILYGGSCKPSNAQELFAMPNIDGGLIGGASLNAEDFLKIVYALSS